jgi:hypothetical protein
MKKIIIILLAISLFSCRAKKEITIEKEYLTVHDTIISEKIVVKTERVTDTLTIEQPCDEKGIIKPFSRKIKTDAGFVYVYSKNGSIHAELDFKGTEQVKENKAEIKHTNKDKSSKSDKLITKYKYPWWLFLPYLYFIYRIYLFFKKKALI